MKWINVKDELPPYNHRVLGIVKSVNEKVEALKKVKDGTDQDATASATEELAREMQKIGEAMASSSAKATEDKKAAEGQEDKSAGEGNVRDVDTEDVDKKDDETTN